MWQPIGHKLPSTIFPRKSTLSGTLTRREEARTLTRREEAHLPWLRGSTGDRSRARLGLRSRTRRRCLHRRRNFWGDGCVCARYIRRGRSPLGFSPTSLNAITLLPSLFRRCWQAPLITLGPCRKFGKKKELQWADNVGLYGLYKDAVHWVSVFWLDKHVFTSLHFATI